VFIGRRELQASQSALKVNGKCVGSSTLSIAQLKEAVYFDKELRELFGSIPTEYKGLEFKNL
jgi:hypothetical protein